MIALYARIRSPGEAARIAEAGYDGTATDEGAGRLALAGPGSTRRVIRSFPNEAPDPAALERVVAEGGEGILLASAGRLLERTGAGGVAALAALCRENGLLCGFGGDLEPPDIPRLLALQPDLLLLDREVRLGGDPHGALDPEALRLLRDLVRVRPDEGAGPAAAPPRRADRIFLRDHVLPVAIGAYDSERGRLQRVRFAVEADLHGTGRPTRDMRDVVSYDLFTDAIRALTTGRHVDFVETLAEEIAARILVHPRVIAVRVTVEKLDVGAGAVGVSIERSRAD